MKNTFVNYDKQRVMRFTVQSFIDFETVACKTVMDVFNDLRGGRLGISDTIILAWAGLKHEDAKLTVQKVAEIIETHLEKDGVDMKSIWEDIFGALSKSNTFKSFVEKDDEKESGEVKKNI